MTAIVSLKLFARICALVGYGNTYDEIGNTMHPPGFPGKPYVAIKGVGGEDEAFTAFAELYGKEFRGAGCVFWRCLPEIDKAEGTYYMRVAII